MNHLVIPTVLLELYVPTGASRLPLVEIDKQKVQTPSSHIQLRSKKHNNSDCLYGTFDKSPLRFSAWEFFHAAKKTELTTSFDDKMGNRRAFAFALEHENTFIWKPDNFRKRNGAFFSLEDFAETGLAGRVGEAVAYLMMVDRGYVFWDRCATVWARAARSAVITHECQLKAAKYISSMISSGKPRNEPDFVFENNNGEVALMEAKGGFVQPGIAYPSTKVVLKQALKQLGAWAKVITPKPSKCYGIATLLREENDTHKDPSLIAYVDPPAEGTSDIEPIKFQPDEIWRGNFGAWLMGMGFRNSGIALAYRRVVETREVELPIVILNGHKYALSIQGWCMDQHRFAPFPWCPVELCYMPGPFRLERMRLMGVTGVYALGLEVNTLKKVCEAITKPPQDVMMDLPNIDLRKQKDDHSPNGFNGSIMPDGSLMGIVSASIFNKVKLMKFQL